jgi:ketosteroid isomerase-like protein
VSQENVEIVREADEAFKRGDFYGFLSRTHPAVEWHAVLERVVEGPESVYRGHEGIRRLWHAYRTELDGFEVEAHELRDAGGDRVVLLGLLRFRGPASRIESESPIGMVVTIRDGLIIHSLDYLSHEEALRAVGLAA